MTNPKARLALMLVLTWMSTWAVLDRVVIPHIAERVTFAELSLAGQNVPPYRYRLFEPVVNRVIQQLFLPAAPDPHLQHAASHLIFLVLVFGMLWHLLSRYLAHFFSPKVALSGLLAFQAVILLSAEGTYMEGDFVTLVIYVAALNLTITNRDRWLPLLLLLGAFVREQTIFIVVFYLLYRFSQGPLTRRTLLIAGGSALLSALVFVGLRVILGAAPTPYTVAFHVEKNLNPSRLFQSTIPLWLAAAVGFIFLSVMAYHQSPRFFRLALISLTVYGGLFFFNGLLNELAKFLPAHLILIPMSLQALTGETFRDPPPAFPNAHS